VGLVRIGSGVRVWGKGGGGVWKGRGFSWSIVRVGRVKVGRIVKEHQRWGSGRQCVRHLNGYYLETRCVCGTSQSCLNGGLFCGTVIYA
jgi:hypothetical protein